jgi:hypothetical protein
LDRVEQELEVDMITGGRPGFADLAFEVGASGYVITQGITFI